MSSIPLTFNREFFPYTVEGEVPPSLKERINDSISVVILNRRPGGSLGAGNQSLIEDLVDYSGVAEIIVISDTGTFHENVDPFVMEHFTLRSLLIHGRATTGEKINAALGAAVHPYVLVLWDDMVFSPSILSGFLLAEKSTGSPMCIVPLLKTSQERVEPSTIFPFATKNGELDFLYLNTTDRKFFQTLYPFDYCGIYNKKKFLFSGGFDNEIENSFWQLADFGMRSYLLGFSLLISSDMFLKYTNKFPVEDRTQDINYARFYLKNLAPIMTNGKISLPLRKLSSFKSRSGLHSIEAVRYFNQVREWIETNRDYFQKDVRYLLATWDEER